MFCRLAPARKRGLRIETMMHRTTRRMNMPSSFFISSVQFNIQQAAMRERALQERLDLPLNMTIRVACPRDVGFHIKRRSQSFSPGVRYDDAHFARNEFRAQIIRMATYAKREPSPIQQGFHQRPQIGNETIVPRHQLIELAATRKILIFEAMRLPRL